MQKPRRKQVRDETFKLLKQEGLDGWRVRFNPRLSRALGRCIPSTKTIEYQPRYMEQNAMEQVLSTIQHEVAHAVAGAHHGHDAHWASIARRLGVKNPSAIATGVTLTRKFTGTCQGCNNQWHRDKRTHGAICPTCRRIRMTTEPTRKCSIIWTRNA